MVIVREAGNLGPFKSVEILEDRLRADGTDYPFAVIEPYSLSENDGLAVSNPDYDGCCAARCAEVTELLLKKMYSNIACAFPAGSRVVQFRHEADRMNITNAMQFAQMLIQAGTPDAICEFRTEDNVWQQTTAAEFAAIAVSIFAAKQALKKQETVHKDALVVLCEAKDMAAIVAYDITAGW